ncbi:gephyrin-like molybdotransferase Glp [Herbiconiux sp.]|uniref:molybdopterin molybdotransferase MoeA n=1 Tax=Herbiconiux sp. TaxID=1871186 RepID=UPI0025C6EAEB|nr:gephyrin-like molybdotransferase Glp [Herbiconiux sp.]
MRTIEDHRRAVLALLAPIAQTLGTETLPLSADRVAADPALYAHRVLAVDLIAPSSLPSFDNSQMDGYAVCAADLAEATPGQPVRLPVAERVAAGDPFRAHRPGTATPVMTGAPIPSGADAVVQIERADPPVFPSDAVRDATVAFTAPVVAGTFVRATGSDVARGDVLLEAGTPLGAAHYGVIAGTGLTEVPVRRRPRVLLVSTGHEIRDAGTELEPGQIFDSNSLALSVALQQIGCTVTARPCRSDEADDLLAVLADGAPDADLVVTVGGVSAGAREVVRDALGPLGVEFLKVALQPGGPQGLGRIVIGAGEHPLPVVCLPGNPVSALVSFEAFVRPALLAVLLAGVDSAPEPALREVRRAPVAHGFDSPPAHHQLRRGILRPDGTLELVGGPSSHLLHSYAASTVLVHVPVGVTDVAAGDELDFWRIDG